MPVFINAGAGAGAGSKNRLWLRPKSTGSGSATLLVVLQTTEAVVPGSNPASLRVENSEDRQSHCAYCKILGQRERPPLRQKKNGM